MTAIQEYITGFISPDNLLLASILAETRTNHSLQPTIGPEAGRLLALLVRLIQAQKVLELGASLGYSTIWLAEALHATGGSLVSVENNERLIEETRKNVMQAGLSDHVTLIHGDASQVIETLHGPFDLILQDSDKALYPHLLDRCINLVRPFGLIVADDTLFRPMGIAEKYSAPVDQYNRKVFADPRLYSTILPIGDGVTISVKIGV